MKRSSACVLVVAALVACHGSSRSCGAPPDLRPRPLVIKVEWTACATDDECTFVSRGCCSEVSVNRAHVDAAVAELYDAHAPYCPVEKACGPGRDGTMAGTPGACIDGKCGPLRARPPPTIASTSPPSAAPSTSVDAKVSGAGFPGLEHEIARYRWMARQCFEQARKTDPTAAGPVTVSLTVGLDGKVKSSHATGGTPPTLATCVATKLGGLQFPEPLENEVTFKVTFTFATKT
ncbi:MAG: AgmX/PglI C-terminal domain-containing protein [Polyangiales bacterium]